MYNGNAVRTPTDYFQVEVLVDGVPVGDFDPREYAFLMENQALGSLDADNDFLVRYYDMAPFGHKQAWGGAAGTNWLLRDDVPDYIQNDFTVMLQDIFDTEVTDWGLPGGLDPRWGSGDTPNFLSVDINESDTYFHTTAGSNSHIHLTSFPGGWDGYTSVPDRLEATLTHEMFHNMQDSIAFTETGEDPWFWNPYGEGTAVLASVVMNPTEQFADPAGYAGSRQYYNFTALFLRDHLNRTYNMPYNAPPDDVFNYGAGLYWRFLYEQCGGLGAGGAENPVQGMKVIWRALQEMYPKAKDDDGYANPHVVEGMKEVMDAALTECPAFDTYEESLIAL
jgi:hypothetical protein